MEAINVALSHREEEVVDLETQLHKLAAPLQNAKEAVMKQMKQHDDKILKAAQKLQDERIKITEIAKRRLEKVF